MIKRILSITFSLLILLLAAYACADSDTGPVSPSSPLQPSPEASAPLSDEPLTQNDTPAAPPENPSASAQQDETSGGQTGSTGEPDALAPISGEVIITFNYERISGSASNQYAVWIEDMEGNIIKTLYASQWTARGGYRTRPDSIALWAEKSGLASMSDSEVNAVSGATPRTGAQEHIWDLTDASGNAVYPGEYGFFVEGTLRWKNYVLYSGVITISDMPKTVQADAEYFYESSDRYAALTSASSENAMIGTVTASFIPAPSR